MTTVGVWLRDWEVAKAFGIGRSTLWTWVKEGILPQPVRFGMRTTRWPSEEIEAVKRKMIEARDGPKPKPEKGRKGGAHEHEQPAA
jgi:predicted DNA-binding transcriptional regulator AlpA